MKEVALWGGPQETPAFLGWGVGEGREHQRPKGVQRGACLRVG